MRKYERVRETEKVQGGERFGRGKEGRWRERWRQRDLRQREKKLKEARGGVGEFCFSRVLGCTHGAEQPQCCSEE